MPLTCRGGQQSEIRKSLKKHRLQMKSVLDGSMINCLIQADLCGLPGFARSDTGIFQYSISSPFSRHCQLCHL